MKKLLFLLIAFVAFQGKAQTAQPASLFGAVAYDIPSKYIKSNIRVSVSVPMGYDPKADTKYPVLYVLDGFYSFPLMHEMHKIMAGEIEPAIIVGIGDDRMSLPEWIITRYPILSYDNVAYEDSFHVANLLRGAPVKLHSGDGALYYDAIKKEVIPFIEANYKTSTDRGLTGHSLSSLFASHVLFKDPGYFSKIGINSAPLFVNDDETMRLEKAFYDSKKSLTGKIFISASSLEGKNLFEKRALNLANALKSRNYSGLTVKHHVFQDESHVSEIGALTVKILYFFYGLPVDRSLGKGHKADK
jgi:predicted alpha/beta superfamily hydrolase